MTQLCNTLLCGKPATWSLSITGGKLYKCDGCKDKGERAHCEGWMKLVPAEPILASRICGLRYTAGQSKDER